MTAAPELARLADHRPLPFAGKLALSAEILLLYVHVRWALPRRDVRATLARLRSPAIERTGAGAVGHAAALRLAGTVVRVLEPLPADSRCLPTAMVLCALLAHRGLPSTLVIGVTPQGAFGAHAWVELDGRPLLPAQAERFARVVEL